MNICIFGASSNDIDQAYMDAVFNLDVADSSADSEFAL